jgi:hypothetical protein
MKLLAPGVEVTLKDGVPRRLILDMEAIVVIEERLGSLSAYLDGLNRGFRGKHVTSILAGLVAGLSHLRDDLDRPAYPARRVSALMDFQSIKLYATALDEAWAQHMPTKDTSRGKDSGRASSSRGKRSTGEPPSHTAEAHASSGA